MNVQNNKKYAVATNSKYNEPVCPNLFDRQFSVSTPDTVNVINISHLKLKEMIRPHKGIIDLFSRMGVSLDFRYSSSQPLYLH